MKIRPLILLGFSLLLANAALAGPINPCTEQTPVPDGSGGTFTAFSCVFTESFPNQFDLTPFITDFGVYTSPSELAENYLVPGVLVFTTNVNNTADESNWTAFIDFHPDQLYDVGCSCYQASDQATVYWAGGQIWPSFSDLTNEGILLVQDGTVFTDDAGLHSFSVVTTPEPSSLILVFSAGMGMLALKRRRKA